jgi:hypothetical protein
MQKVPAQDEQRNLTITIRAKFLFKRLLVKNELALLIKLNTETIY